MVWSSRRHVMGAQCILSSQSEVHPNSISSGLITAAAIIETVLLYLILIIDLIKDPLFRLSMQLRTFNVREIQEECN